MKTHPAIKILVLFFSIAVGGLMVWQLTKNLSGSDPQESVEQNETAVEKDKDTPAKHPPIIISSKNPAGSIDITANPEVRELFEPEQKEEEKEARPILPSSKSIQMPLFRNKK